MEDIKRVRYFEYEFLDAEDFKVEQDYHRGMRYKHNRDFHTWGIGGGLEVNFAEGQETGSETKVTISPGTAVDGEGREIVLVRSKNVEFNQPGYVGGHSYYITINWHEQPGLPGQQNELKRWEETPEIDTSEVFPANPDMNLVLAKVTLRADVNKTIASIDNQDRRYAAIELGDDTVSSTKIVKADGTTGQDTNRGDGIKTDHIQDRAVTAVKLDEDVEKSLIPAGCVAAFAMETPPDSWLECNGQAIDRTEYERLFNAIGTTFGAGNGDTTFNVPDLRGRFVRGWAHGSANDPDRLNRAASASGGASGDSVGSYQDDTLQAHIHNFQGQYTNTGWADRDHAHYVAGAYEYGHVGHHEILFNRGWAEGGARNTSRWTGGFNTNHLHYYTPNGTITDPTSGRTSLETRPKNIYLMYCIKY
jgi:microcystin-dependent protein